LTATAKAIELATIAGNAAVDKIAENIVAFDVTSINPLADVVVMASGRNERQVGAIADGIEEKMLELGQKLLRREGKAQGRWVLLDFGDIWVHVMHEEHRMFYGLERLWKDCPLVKLELHDAPAA
jgi:ribosome-associated protein